MYIKMEGNKENIVDALETIPPGTFTHLPTAIARIKKSIARQTTVELKIKNGWFGKVIETIEIVSSGDSIYYSREVFKQKR